MPSPRSRRDRPGPRGLSSLVKLPLGVHRATLRRCALLDDDLSPIADPAASLQRLEAAPDEAVAAALGERPPAPPAWTPFAGWLDDLPPWSGDVMGELVARLRRIEQKLEKG